MANTLAHARQRFFDAQGVPLAFGKVWTYDAGTTVPRPTFADAGEVTANPNPVILDVNGEATIYWRGTYKVNLTTSADAQVPGWPEDDVTDITTLATAGDVLIAAGDGVLDDYARVQAVINANPGKRIKLAPGQFMVSAALRLTEDGTELVGSGAGTVVTATATSINVIEIEGAYSCTVSDMLLVGNGDLVNAAYLQCNGVLVRSAIRCSVLRVTTQNCAASGVILYNSDHCTVAGCRITNSPNASVPGTSANTSSDIAAVYSSRRNLIYGNHCISGGATGITVQSILDTDDCQGNIITCNVVRNPRAYGIIVYRNDSGLALGKIEHTIVSHNAVFSVLGDVFNSAAGNYSFGAGIYVQGAEYTIVSDNQIYGTHLAAVDFTNETLAPGAIGTTNCANVSIVDNVIRDAGFYGINVGNPAEKGPAEGAAVIKGNRIDGTVKSGIFLKDRSNCDVEGNWLTDIGGSGIRANRTITTGNTRINVRGNTINVSAGTASIELNYISIGEVANNTCVGSTGHGIALASCSDVQILGCSVHNHALRGIYVDSACSDIALDSIVVKGSGTSTSGIDLRVLCSVGAVDVSGCVTPFAGTVPFRDTVTILEFGATTTAASNTSALQAAINYAKLYGLTLLGANGEFTTGPLNVREATKAWKFIGPGSSQMTLRHVNGNGTLLNGGGLGSTVPYTIQGMTLDCGLDRFGYIGNHHGISIGYTSGVEIRDITVRNTMSTGIMVWDDTNSGNYTGAVIEDCKVFGDGVRCSNGILVASIPKSKIINCYAEGAVNGVNGPGHGQQIKNVGHDSEIIGGRSVNCTVGYGFGNDQALGILGPQRCRILGGQTSGCTAALEGLSFGYSTVQLAHVENSGFQGYNVRLTGICDGNTITVDAITGGDSVRAAFLIRPYCAGNTLRLNNLGSREGAGIIAVFDTAYAGEVPQYCLRGVAISAAGTGYTAGDVVTLTGLSGLVAPTVRITAVSAGVPTQVVVESHGWNATAAAGPISTTGGTGSGLTITPTWHYGPLANSINVGTVLNPLNHANGTRSMVTWSGTTGNFLRCDTLPVIERVTITSGVATISNSAVDLVELSGEGGVADTLDTIAGYFPDGVAFDVRPTSGSVDITLSHGTGNIFLPGLTNFLMDNVRDRASLAAHLNGTTLEFVATSTVSNGV
jgi:hypothetical protein